MSAFDQGFADRHAAVLAAMAGRFGLEYVGIDCAELPDGGLIAFEGDISMVVHDMDPPNLYPYKSPAIQKLFAAFYDMLKRKSLLGLMSAPVSSSRNYSASGQKSDGSSCVEYLSR